MTHSDPNDSLLELLLLVLAWLEVLVVASRLTWPSAVRAALLPAFTINSGAACAHIDWAAGLFDG